MSIVEFLLPRRFPTVSRKKRWSKIFVLYFFNVILLQLVSTATIVNLAYFTWKNGWGLLNCLNLNPWIQFFLSILLLDFQAYVTHALYHKIPFGWRIHRIHHLDLDMDSATGLLFHPLESLITFLFRQAFIVVAGPFPLSVLLFDLFTVLGLFATHANIKIFPVVERGLKWFFVTPDMHRIHHSTDWDESNSNYGFSISWWDRLFRTYRAVSFVPQEKMKLGLKEFQDPDCFSVSKMLWLPFLKKRNYPQDDIEIRKSADSSS